VLVLRGRHPADGRAAPAGPAAPRAAVTAAQRAAIRAAYLDGEPLDRIAALAGVQPEQADIYLCWWCDRGCPSQVP
jgi:hypothetical protein